MKNLCTAHKTLYAFQRSGFSFLLFLVDPTFPKKLESSSYMNFNFEMFSVWICLSIVEYQYLCVVNLSRRQTLIKIFTKYLPRANINISAIFTKQNQRLSIPCLQSHLNSRSMRNWLYWRSFARKATFSSKHHWYSV